MNNKKRSKPANLAPEKQHQKIISKNKKAADSNHKNRFEQLLDDAVLGVKKK